MADEPENLALGLLRDIRKEASDMRAEQADMRSELRDHRGVLLGLSDQVRRLARKLSHEIRGVETKMSDLRDDLELIVKTEVMGRWAHTETMLEARLERRFDELTGDREPPGP